MDAAIEAKVRAQSTGTGAVRAVHFVKSRSLIWVVYIALGTATCFFSV